jgi:hypothetical protein
MPLGRPWLTVFPISFLVAAAAFRIALRGRFLRSLGEIQFGSVVFWWLVLVTALLLTDTVQLLRTWRRLRWLLVLLDRLRLRRTLAAMKGIAWGSVWKMGGNVLEERYRVLSRQFESLINLNNELLQWLTETTEEEETRDTALKRIATCLDRGMIFAQWYVALSTQRKRGLSFRQWYKVSPARDRRKPFAFAQWLIERLDQRLVNDVGPMNRFQAELADTAGAVMSLVLRPEWAKETDSLLIDKSRLQSQDSSPAGADHHFAPTNQVPDVVRAAEEFFILPYLGFIQNTLGRIRTMVFGLLALFVGMTLAVSSYPFDPLPVLGGLFLAMFVLVGVVVVTVYAGMHRDATLSHVTNTNQGELGLQFWGQLLTFGIGPLFALLTTLFPSMTDFLVSWFQPSAQALK